MEAINERELVERCRRGDEGAFSGTGRPTQGSGVRLDRAHGAGPIAGGRSGAGRIPAGPPGPALFSREARLSTWIYRIVANVCVQDHGRAAPALSLDDERTRARVTPSASDRQFGALELRDRLEKAIARLPANYRLLVAAHYLNGVQYEDLAEALALPLGTVKTQLHRAKQQLRRMWKRTYDDRFKVQGSGFRARSLQNR